MTEGFIYTAYGRAHLSEAFKSLESLRKVHPDAHVTLVTTGNAGRDYPFNKFDKYITNPHTDSSFLGGKVMRMLPHYDKNIYLDTDTWICQPLEPLFEMLDHYDVVVAPDPGEVEVEGMVAPNTGVVAFRANDKVDDFLALYREYYNERELWKNHPGRKQRTDQPAFSLALRDSEVRYIQVPQNWNARYRWPVQLHSGKVKIIHGLDCDFEIIKDAMDVNYKEHRIWDPKQKKIVGFKLCKACSKTKGVYDNFYLSKAGGYSTFCKPCAIEQTRQNKKKRPEHYKKWQQSYARKRFYGLSEEDHRAMLAAQNGRCAICGGTGTKGDPDGLDVDHDHETGVVRGLLCRTCNLGLGMLGDTESSLRRAMKYLKIEDGSNE